MGIHIIMDTHNYMYLTAFHIKSGGSLFSFSHSPKRYFSVTLLDKKSCLLYVEATSFLRENLPSRKANESYTTTNVISMGRESVTATPWLSIQSSYRIQQKSHSDEQTHSHGRPESVLALVVNVRRIHTYLPASMSSPPIGERDNVLPN